MRLKEALKSQGKPQGWVPALLALCFVAWAGVSLRIATHLDLLARPGLDPSQSACSQGDAQAFQTVPGEHGRRMALSNDPDPAAVAAEGAPLPAPVPAAAAVPILPFASMDEICPGINAENLAFPQVALLPDVVPLPLAAAIVAAAERYAAATGGWTTDRHANYPTTDLDTADVPVLAFLVRNLVHIAVVPRMAAAFGLHPLQLGISEVFIAKYSAEVEGHQRSLDAHLNGPDFSFVVALNEGFAGGGTRFEATGDVAAPPAGSAVTFCGQNRHAGLPVTAGTRYILAGFMLFGEPGGCQYRGQESGGDDGGGGGGEESEGDGEDGETGVVFQVRHVEDV